MGIQIPLRRLVSASLSTYLVTQFVDKGLGDSKFLREATVIGGALVSPTLSTANSVTILENSLKTGAFGLVRAQANGRAPRALKIAPPDIMASLVSYSLRAQMPAGDKGWTSNSAGRTPLLWFYGNPLMAAAHVCSKKPRFGVDLTWRRDPKCYIDGDLSNDEEYSLLQQGEISLNGCRVYANIDGFRKFDFQGLRYTTSLLDSFLGKVAYQPGIQYGRIKGAMWYNARNGLTASKMSQLSAEPSATDSNHKCALNLAHNIANGGVAAGLNGGNEVSSCSDAWAESCTYYDEDSQQAFLNAMDELAFSGWWNFVNPVFFAVGVLYDIGAAVYSAFHDGWDNGGKWWIRYIWGNGDEGNNTKFLERLPVAPLMYMKDSRKVSQSDRDAAFESTQINLGPYVARAYAVMMLAVENAPFGFAVQQAANWGYTASDFRGRDGVRAPTYFAFTDAFYNPYVTNPNVDLEAKAVTPIDPSKPKAFRFVRAVEHLYDYDVADYRYWGWIAWSSAASDITESLSVHASALQKPAAGFATPQSLVSDDQIGVLSTPANLSDALVGSMSGSPCVDTADMAVEMRTWGFSTANPLGGSCDTAMSGVSVMGAAFAQYDPPSLDSELIYSVKQGVADYDKIGVSRLCSREYVWYNTGVAIDRYAWNTANKVVTAHSGEDAYRINDPDCLLGQQASSWLLKKMGPAYSDGDWKSHLSVVRSNEWLYPLYNGSGDFKGSIIASNASDSNATLTTTINE
jgi:hypothetical protein